jgi:3D (Asp-Asp-Asp) domain-containing protein
MPIKRFFISSLAAVCLLTAATVVSAQTNNLNWNSSSATWQIQIINPPAAIAQQNTFIGQLRALLGIRSVTRIQPPVGTKLIVQASAYAPSPYQTDATPCTTAIGTHVRPGVVATNFLPFGTILQINGEKYIVEDRMNSRYDGYYMDIWFPSTSSALEFGRHKLDITIIGYGNPGQDVRATPTPTPSPEATTVTDSTNTKPGFWNTVKQDVSAITVFLTTKVNPNVNNADVNCNF